MKHDKSLPRHTPVPPVVEVGDDPRTKPPLWATSEPGHKKSLQQFQKRQNPATCLPVGTPISTDQASVDLHSSRKRGQ
jgi:hypothetical protein